MNDLQTIDAPDELKTQVAQCVTWSQENTIVTANDFQATAWHLQDIKAAQKVADEFFDPPIRQAYDLHKMLVGRKKLVTESLDRSESIDKRKMLAYQTAERDKAEAERRRLQAEADEKARREREALERKALAAKKPETQQRYAEAAAAVSAPVVHVSSEAPTMAGISTRTIWRVRVVNAALVPREFLEVDLRKLAKYAGAMKEMATVPGVEFYTESAMSARSK